MSRYTDSVHRELRGIRRVSPSIADGCDKCPDVEPEAGDEGFFSSVSCDACGSTFGGQRYAAHGFTDEDELIHLDICTDCLFYLANGDTPEDWRRYPGEGD